MRLSNRIFAALPLVAALPLSLTVVPAPPGAQDEGQEHEEHEDALPEAMEAMQDGMRSLGRSLRSPEGRADALAAITGMREGLAGAVGSEPPYPAELTDATAQARHRIAFQRMLIKTLDTVLALEDALHTGDTEQAQARFGELRELKSNGHEHFQVEEEDQ